ncbi:hypothetical protein VNI00_001732 [Paramarasmius palmivorus]|uniref:Adipose-regulatory protein n=1 Tax=Paramarasmius palmivorus TaxID=297713 RepID=A0AAW0E4T6_9AGAR
MAGLSLLSSTNKTIEATRKPALVVQPPRSYLFGTPNTVSLTIPFFNSFIPGTSYVEAEVRLGRHDSWKSIGRGEGRELSVISAELRGAVAHHGIRGLVTRFPLLSAMAASATFLSIIAIILGACLLPTIIHGASETALGEEDEKPDTVVPAASVKEIATEDSDSESELEKTRRKKRSKSSRSSSRRRSLVKPEPEPEIMPSATQETASPLRRRGSRPSRVDDS